eukprot:TRINITY_DN390_c2_g1_i2.p3 TRINITY_DN390_c2_g1~~TRINITY_DN390_c2_g1_i2.p3  ORF type:complete len:256 (+),score=71.14 TRINITY_DN390_c2_g1_i2:99-866(+)
MLKTLLEHNKVSDEHRKELVTMRMGKHKQTLLSVLTYTNIVQAKGSDMMKEVFDLVPKEFFVARDVEGATALHQATKQKKSYIVEKLLDKEAKNKLAGGEISSKVEDNVGLTPLDVSMNHLCQFMGGKVYSLKRDYEESQEEEEEDHDNDDFEDSQEDEEMEDVDVTNQTEVEIVTGIYKKVAKTCRDSKKRRYPTFDEVQISRTIAVDEVNEEEENKQEETYKWNKKKKINIHVYLSEELHVHNKNDIVVQNEF